MILRNAWKYLLRTQTELLSIVSLGFLRYSCFTELQFKFMANLFFHILDRVLIFCLVETSCCQNNIHHYWQTQPLNTSLTIQYVFMAYSSVKKRSFFMVQRGISYHGSLCFWERGGEKPLKTKIHSHRYYKVCTLNI